MNTGESSQLGKHGFGSLQFLLENIMKMGACCFDTDFVSQMKLITFPLIHCLDVLNTELSNRRNFTTSKLIYGQDFVLIIFYFFSDHVAIPDFSAGAMENWGLVLYRETALLHDDIKSSISNKYWVSLVMAHEIAHTVSLNTHTHTHTHTHWR